MTGSPENNIGIARDSRFNWEDINPIIPYYVICIEDNGKMKVGDINGLKYAELPYINIIPEEFNLKLLLANYPKSDGAGLNSGDIYIDSITGHVVVKL